MSHLVVGAGEVGQALAAVLSCDIVDKDNGLEAPRGTYDFIHVTFPYQIEDFVGTVQMYQDHYAATHVVVHSTVKVGTCDPRGWTHSPVRGKHPNLEAGLRTFCKHYGGEHALDVANELEWAFPMWAAHDEAAITELGKLLELTHYGLEIVVQRYAREMCRRLGLPFHEVYTDFFETYNLGWLELGEKHLLKQILDDSDGPIGGHCVVAGAELLNKSYRNLLSEVVMTVQKELKGEL